MWVTLKVKKSLQGLMKYVDDRWWKLRLKTVRSVNVYMNLKLEKSNYVWKSACPRFTQPHLTAFASSSSGSLCKKLSPCPLNFLNWPPQWGSPPKMLSYIDFYIYVYSSSPYHYTLFFHRIQFSKWQEWTIFCWNL